MTRGCSLHHIWLQLPSHRAAAYFCENTAVTTGVIAGLEGLGGMGGGGDGGGGEKRDLGVVTAKRSPNLAQSWQSEPSGQSLVRVGVQGSVLRLRLRLRLKVRVRVRVWVGV